MLTLGARTTSGSYSRLEGYINEPLNFTLQFSDIENIQSPAGSYSQTFTLPNTAAVSYTHLTLPTKRIV